MAVDRSDTERRVAIKKIASAFRDPVDMKRFLRELRYAQPQRTYIRRSRSAVAHTGLGWLDF
jgi:hypothetical protein